MIIKIIITNYKSQITSIQSKIMAVAVIISQFGSFVINCVDGVSKL